jgi:tetratricopeptide (TPR) repeat protein
LQQTAREGEEPRLTMLETIREYGLERLAEQGERESVQAAHALYFVRLAEHVEPERRGPQQTEWFAWVEREHENLRMAMQTVLAQGEGELDLRLGTALWWFWYARGATDWKEGSLFLDRALEINEGVGGAVRAKALLIVGQLAGKIGDFERAESLCREGLALFQELGDRRGMGEGYWYLGFLALQKTDFIAARPLLEQGLALCREVGNGPIAGWSLLWLGFVIFHQGEYGRGLSLSEESLTLFREAGNLLAVVRAVLNLAQMYLSFSGDVAKARVLAEEGLALARGLRNKVGEGEALYLLSSLALHEGQTALARTLIEEGHLCWKELGDDAARGNLAWNLARVETREGNLLAAQTHFAEYLALVKDGKIEYYPWDVAVCLQGLAGVMAAQGETMLAACLWGVAASLRERCGIMLTPVERADYEPAVAAARTRLDQQTFAEAMEGGRSMTVEQILATLVRPAQTSSALTNQQLPASQTQEPSVQPD